MNAENINTETLETQLSQDLLKKLKSRRWRLDNLYKFVDKDSNIKIFKMNLVQKILYLGLWFYSVVLKARQPGVTTFFCLFGLDLCLFNSNTLALFISYNRDEMKETFHNKIKFAYDNLPELVKQMNPTVKSDANQLRFENGSSIRVTTSGRGGTYQFVHISEYGLISKNYPQKARDIKTGTLNAVHPGKFIVIESTAEGREGEFYEICQKAQALQQQRKELSIMDPKFFFFPWFRNTLNLLSPKNIVIYDYQKKYFEEIEAKLNISLSPEQKAWYVAKWNQQGDDMKKEHPSTPEEAFEAAIRGAYYQSQFVQVRKEGRICKVPYQEGTVVDTWWDLGFNDENSIWLTQDIGREIHVIDYYRNSGEGLKHYFDYLRELPYRYGRHTAPWDINVHELSSGTTRKKAAQKLGVNFAVAPKTSVQAGIEMVRQVLKICWFDEEKCSQGITGLENYRKEWNEKLGCYRNTPLHDSNSNPADAFRTLGTTHKFIPAFEVSPMAIEQAKQKQKEKADPGGWT